VKGVRFPLFLLLAFIVPLSATAHDARPVYLDVHERAAGEYAVQWKVPTSLPRFALPAVVFPEACVALGETVTVEYPDAFLSRRDYRCEEPLAGSRISLAYPVHNPSLSTLFRLSLRSGESFTRVYSPEESSWVVPGGGTPLTVAKDYTVLGIEHILFGLDHVLFVFGLLLLVSGAGRLLKTITAFTVAHSITLALAAMGVVKIPAAPVEAVVALSIVFVACELVQKSRGRVTLAQRAPWVVAFSFGLLHGFGFAGTLAKIGLPIGEIPLALLFFNVGVEVGQLAFVSVVLAALASLATLEPKWPRWSAPVPGYLLGSLAAFWFIERCVGMFG